MKETSRVSKTVKCIGVALCACLLLLSGAEAWAKKPQVDPEVPLLRPMTLAQAEALAAYAREMRIRNQLDDEDGVAWSMITAACTYRALALQYAIVAAQTLPIGDIVES